MLHVGASVSPPRVVNIADLRRLAERRLPRMVFDYIDGGAEADLTMRETCRAFETVTFRPRSAIATPAVDLRATVIGHMLELPLLLGPVGSSRLFWPRGEAVASRAAGKAGTVYVLSTLSGTRPEEVKEAPSGTCWYQLYLCGGREVASSAIARAKGRGVSPRLVTSDPAVAGLRERDVRNGTRELLSRQPLTMLPWIMQILERPGWLMDYLTDGGLMKFPNVVLPEGPMRYQDVAAALEQSVVVWDDFRWI